MDDYENINNKYRKYKEKYLNLKNQIGGSKLDKTESGYVNAYPSIRCGTCRHFTKGDEIVDVEAIGGKKVSGKLGECEIVSGDIHEYGCCNLWVPKGGKSHFDFLGGNEVKKKIKKPASPMDA